MARRSRSRRSLRPERRRLLVVTEGQATEPQYVERLNQHLRDGPLTVSVKTVGVGKDPRLVVKKCAEERDRAAKCCGTSPNGEPRSRWCRRGTTSRRHRGQRAFPPAEPLPGVALEFMLDGAADPRRHRTVIVGRTNAHSLQHIRRKSHCHGFAQGSATAHGWALRHLVGRVGVGLVLLLGCHLCTHQSSLQFTLAPGRVGNHSTPR